MNSEASNTAGLCESCRHHKRLVSSRGSIFYQCKLAETNPVFARYPALPVTRCKGYEPLNLNQKT
jgi:hypothetical protein